MGVLSLENVEDFCGVGEEEIPYLEFNVIESVPIRFHFPVKQREMDMFMIVLVSCFTINFVGRLLSAITYNFGVIVIQDLRNNIESIIEAALVSNLKSTVALIVLL